MITPRISLVAFEDREPGFVFVAVPNERGRYIRTDKSVVLVPCDVCGATVGEPCMSAGPPGSPDAKYGGTTHYRRRAKVRTFRQRADDIVESPVSVTHKPTATANFACGSLGETIE